MPAQSSHPSASDVPWVRHSFQPLGSRFLSPIGLGARTGRLEAVCAKARLDAVGDGIGAVLYVPPPRSWTQRRRARGWRRLSPPSIVPGGDRQPNAPQRRSHPDALGALIRQTLERNLRAKWLPPDFRAPFTDARVCLGLLCGLQRRFDEAAEWFAQARVVLEEQGARPHRARIDLYEARMYLRRGAAGDGERAARLLRAALEEFHAIGMPGWARRAEEMLAQLEHAGDSASPAELSSTPGRYSRAGSQPVPNGLVFRRKVIIDLSYQGVSTCLKTPRAFTISRISCGMPAETPCADVARTVGRWQGPSAARVIATRPASPETSHALLDAEVRRLTDVASASCARNWRRPSRSTTASRRVRELRSRRWTSSWPPRGDPVAATAPVAALPARPLDGWEGTAGAAADCRGAPHAGRAPQRAGQDRDLLRLPGRHGTTDRVGPVAHRAPRPRAVETGRRGPGGRSLLPSHFAAAVGEGALPGRKRGHPSGTRFVPVGTHFVPPR